MWEMDNIMLEYVHDEDSGDNGNYCIQHALFRKTVLFQSKRKSRNRKTFTIAQCLSIEVTLLKAGKFLWKLRVTD